MTKKKATPKEIIDQTLLNCQEILETHKFVSVISSITLNEDNIELTEHSCLISPYFVLIAKSPTEYILSFTLTTYHVYQVAFLTHVLTLYLYDALFIEEDNFRSVDQTFYFGVEAYERFKKYVQDKNGVINCPICERTVLKEIFDVEKGFCKICEELELPYVTIH